MGISLETSKDWYIARGAVRDTTWNVAQDVTRGVESILVEDLVDFKNKYPNGTFINLIPLWELGLYPVGVIGGKFVIYVPPIKTEFNEIN